MKTILEIIAGATIMAFPFIMIWVFYVLTGNLMEF